MKKQTEEILVDIKLSPSGSLDYKTNRRTISMFLNLLKFRLSSRFLGTI